MEVQGVFTADVFLVYEFQLDIRASTALLDSLPAHSLLQLSVHQTAVQLEGHAQLQVNVSATLVGVAPIVISVFLY